MIPRLQLVMSCVLIFSCFASTSIQAQGCPHQGVLDKLDKALMEKNADLLAEVYHEDAVRHLQGENEEGLAKIQENAKTFYTNIPDAKSTTHDVVCSGDMVVVRWEGTGHPNGSPNMVKVTGLTMYKIVNGKVAEEWEEMSSLSLMMQLGYELKPPGDK